MNRFARFALAGAALFFVCGVNGFGAEKVSKNVARPQLVDWQGKSEGNEIPKWVKAFTIGDNRAVCSDLGIDAGKNQIFCFMGTGENLDDAYAKSLFDVATNYIQMLMDIASGGAAQSPSGDENLASFFQASIPTVRYTIESSSSGIESSCMVDADFFTKELKCRASFWIKKEVGKNGSGRKQDIYDVYSVWTKPNAEFGSQVAELMKNSSGFEGWTFSSFVQPTGSWMTQMTKVEIVDGEENVVANEMDIRFVDPKKLMK